MERKLSGKIVLVTGAASGIGQAAALRVAEEGAAVTIVADLRRRPAIRPSDKSSMPAARRISYESMSHNRKMSNPLFVRFANSTDASIARATMPESMAIGRIR